MNVKALAALQRIAKLKSERALTELAAARRRADAEAARADEIGRALQDTYAEADGPQSLSLWRLRVALEAQRRQADVAVAAARAEAEEARARAASAAAREHGADSLMARARAHAALADARRAERSAGLHRPRRTALDI